MLFDQAEAHKDLVDFNFTHLFIELLGWDHLSTKTLSINASGHAYTLEPVAQKSGLVVFSCSILKSLPWPNHATRMVIERETAKKFHEHLLIFVDMQKGVQVWQWVKREPGRPLCSREHHYTTSQSGRSLMEKLQALVYTLDDDEEDSIVDTSSRVKAAFDVDRVTRQFYEKFKAELGAFLSFITGIKDVAASQWYASVMLNRLMFIYFVQKKGFLDGDVDYLRNRLTQLKQHSGHDSFLSFYRHFLLRLFHEGLARPDRTSELDTILGRVPYLNGGLFDVHQLEAENPQIDIPDKAFERLFDFFDAYQWRLDDRPLHNDNEINPDVLGYIFEQYINQKQMGAYYTKEDITGYISRNTIIPYLFDTAARQQADAFAPAGPIWRLLREDPDRYIHSAVRKGVDEPLPAFISAGIDDPTQRDNWDRSADQWHALPTETWREYIARRTRCQDLRTALRSGRVNSINDLITNNIDIIQFSQDVIDNCESPELLAAFYAAIEHITILDPTCGSGAFLFAALNVLNPLYEASIQRMEAFLQEHQAGIATAGVVQQFRDALERVEQHPNRRYFILKSVVLNNLYGVDIMAEAVEVCKLRLFLKLVAQVDTTDQIEPLPDIDFNIRAGNALIGFATYDDARRAVTQKLDFSRRLPEIESAAKATDRVFSSFRFLQLVHSTDAQSLLEAKRALQESLSSMRSILDQALATEYGIDEGDRRNNYSSQFSTWLSAYHPFHWFVEFYGPMNAGGFDVIIGNPPYIATSKVRQNYIAKGFVTSRATDIYAWVIERSTQLLHVEATFGMILPLSIAFSSDFASCRQLLFSNFTRSWSSSYGRIPSALFSFDVRVRNVIYLGRKTAVSRDVRPQLKTTSLRRWNKSFRPFLFDTIEYTDFTPAYWNYRIPKVSQGKIAGMFEELRRSQPHSLGFSLSSKLSGPSLYFKKTAYNWLNFCKSLPPCYDASGMPIQHTKFGSIFFRDSYARDLAFLLLNGKIMFAYWCIVGDDFDVTSWMFSELPIALTSFSEKSSRQLINLVPLLENAMAAAVTSKLNAGKTVGNYNLAKCRGVTDLADKLFLEGLGFTDAWSDIQLLYSRMIRTESADADIS